MNGSTTGLVAYRQSLCDAISTKTLLSKSRRKIDQKGSPSYESVKLIMHSEATWKATVVKLGCQLAASDCHLGESPRRA